MRSFIRLMGLALVGAWLSACNNAQTPDATQTPKNAKSTPALDPHIEYIGHASFRFADETGKAVVIDPYNSRIWVEHRFPSDVKADAVLVTHPHYDHDATYYLEGAEVYRDPGTYKIGDIQITGVATAHRGEDRMRERGLSPVNTVWVIELEGVRFLHLGDTRPLKDTEIAEIGPVDILISNLNGTDELKRLKDGLNARAIIPMHYFNQLSPEDKAPRGLGDVNTWLDPYEAVQKFETNRIDIADIQGYRGVLSLRHSPDLTPWTEAQDKAATHFNDFRTAMRAEPADPDTAKASLQAAIDTDPGNILYYRIQAGQIAEADSRAAIQILETGLNKADHLDWSQAIAAHDLLAGLYEKTGNIQAAKTSYQWISERPKDYNLKAHQKALDFLAANGG